MEFVFVPRVEESVVATLAIVVVYLLAVSIGNLCHGGSVVVDEVFDEARLGGATDGAVEAVGQVVVVSLRIAKELDICHAQSCRSRGFLQRHLKPRVAAVVGRADLLTGKASAVVQLYAAHQLPLLSVGAHIEHQLLEVLLFVVGADHREPFDHVGPVSLEDDFLCALQLWQLEYGEVVLVEERCDVRSEAYRLEGAVVDDAIVGEILLCGGC